MNSSARSALALTPVPFEDLGPISGPVHTARGFAVGYAAATANPFPFAPIERAGLLIVLGSPIGVYEAPEVPFFWTSQLPFANASKREPLSASAWVHGLSRPPLGDGSILVKSDRILARTHVAARAGSTPTD